MGGARPRDAGLRRTLPHNRRHMRAPLVSVALCTFRGARHLAGLLDSLLAQRHENLEIVAVDDASDDGTADILRRHAQLDPRIRVEVNPRTLGYNANFAAAFGRCRGALIAPCDQDDVWHADKLEALVAAIGDADLAYCDSELVDAGGRSLHARLSATRRMYEGADPLALVTTNSASGHAMLFRRELLDRAQPFPPGVHYDWWLALTAASGKGIRYVDRPLVRFRRHGAAATGIGRATSGPGWRDWLEGRRRLLREMKRLGGRRRDDVAELERAFGGALERGRWLALLRLVVRHREPLTRVLGGPPTLIRRLLRRS